MHEDSSQLALKDKDTNDLPRSEAELGAEHVLLML